MSERFEFKGISEVEFQKAIIDIGKQLKENKLIYFEITVKTV